MSNNAALKMIDELLPQSDKHKLKRMTAMKSVGTFLLMLECEKNLHELHVPKTVSALGGIHHDCTLTYESNDINRVIELFGFFKPLPLVLIKNSSTSFIPECRDQKEEGLEIGPLLIDVCKRTPKKAVYRWYTNFLNRLCKIEVEVRSDNNPILRDVTTVSEKGNQVKTGKSEVVHSFDYASVLMWYGCEFATLYFDMDYGLDMFQQGSLRHV